MVFFERSCLQFVTWVLLCIVRNTTGVDEFQVAITYTFDLAVRNVRGHIASNVFKE